MNKLIIAFFCFLFLFGCNKRGSTTEGKYTSADFYYDKGLLNNLNITYSNISKDNPVIIFVHGGGWNQGTYLTWINEQKKDFFLSHGYNLVTINYSLSPNPFELNNPYRVQHPAHVRDLAKSVKWVRENAFRFKIDANQIFLMGHSSGAQMVGLLATNEKYLHEEGLGLENIQGVISLDGGPYLTLDKDLLLYTDNRYYKEIKNAYLNAFSTDETKQMDATPYYHIEEGKNIPPFLFISQGPEVPYRYKPNRMMDEKMKQYGIISQHIIAPWYEHNRILNCIGTTDDKDNISNTILDFLELAREK